MKESDRLTGTAELVRAFGAGAEIRGDDLLVTGTGALHGARVDAPRRSSDGDGRGRRRRGQCARDR